MFFIVHYVHVCGSLHSLSVIALTSRKAEPFLYSVFEES
jgi:hypothetical protein